MTTAETTMWITLVGVWVTYLHLRHANSALSKVEKERQLLAQELAKARELWQRAEDELAKVTEVKSEIDVAKDHLAEGARLISEGYPQQAMDYLRSCGFSISQKRKSWH